LPPPPPPPDGVQALVIARAFSHFLSLANCAEQKHKARARDAGAPSTRAGASASQEAVVVQSLTDLLFRGHLPEEVYHQVR
jgi:phosphoenolpyruvate carboxylase